MMRGFLICVLLLSGCSSPSVRCDAHLKPINASADKTTSESVADRVSRRGSP
jgi:uncharacterized lipoprotein YmbA